MGKRFICTVDKLCMGQRIPFTPGSWEKRQGCQWIQIRYPWVNTSSRIKQHCLTKEMERVYALCSSQFVQLVLPVPEDCRWGGAEAARAVPVVMPVLQSVARLEFRLQSTDPNDPSQLGRSLCFSQTSLLWLHIPGQISVREKSMVFCISAKKGVTGSDILVCEVYFAVITTPLLLSSCTKPSFVWGRSGLLRFGFDNKIVSFYDFAQSISFLLHWLHVCIKHTPQHFSTKVRILVKKCLLPLIKTLHAVQHMLNCFVKQCPARVSEGKECQILVWLVGWQKDLAVGIIPFPFSRSCNFLPFCFLTMRF